LQGQLKDLNIAERVKLKNVFGVSLFLEACLDVQELLVDCKPGHLE
jgi:hypothetical protein